MLVCGQSFLCLVQLFCFGDQIIIRGDGNSEWGQMWRSWVVGKITRTAAGRAATLTIVWQKFSFQLCTTLLSSSSPSTLLPFLCLPISAWLLSNQVFFKHLFSSSRIHAFLSFLWKLGRFIAWRKIWINLSIRKNYVCDRRQTWLKSHWTGIKQHFPKVVKKIIVLVTHKS